MLGIRGNGKKEGRKEYTIIQHTHTWWVEGKGRTGC